MLMTALNLGLQSGVHWSQYHCMRTRSDPLYAQHAAECVCVCVCQKVEIAPAGPQTLSVCLSYLRRIYSISIEAA